MRRIIGLFYCVTLFAFILSATIPFLAVYNTTTLSSDLSNAPAIFGDKIIICTENGFKLVSIESLADDHHSTPTEHTNFQCALCYIAAQQMHYVDPTILHSTVAYLDSHSISYVRPNSTSIISYRYTLADSRAPPTSFV